MFQKKKQVEKGAPQDERKTNCYDDELVKPKTSRATSKSKIILFMLKYKATRPLIIKMTLKKFKKGLLKSCHRLKSSSNGPDTNETHLDEGNKKCSFDNYYIMIIFKILESEYFQSRKDELIPEILRIYFKCRHTNPRNVKKMIYLEIINLILLPDKKVLRSK